MQAEIVIAGFGGQGVMVLGELLAYAGMLENRNVSWFPSYGPEMRGGTANCTVVISDRRIGSPVVSRPGILVAMNLPSLLKFAPSVLENGLILYNSSLIEQPPDRQDVRVISVPANKIADDLGESRIANMVVLGALIGASGVVSLDAVTESLKKVLPARRHNLIPLNRKALEAGMALASAVSA